MTNYYFYKNLKSGEITTNMEMAREWYKSGAIVEYWQGEKYNCKLIAWCMWN